MAICKPVPQPSKAEYRALKKIQVNTNNLMEMITINIIMILYHFKAFTLQFYEQYKL